MAAIPVNSPVTWPIDSLAAAAKSPDIHQHPLMGHCLNTGETVGQHERIVAPNQADQQLSTSHGYSGRFSLAWRIV